VKSLHFGKEATSLCLISRPMEAQFTSYFGSNEAPEELRMILKVIIPVMSVKSCDAS
jgi:hypothetical protein